MKLTEIGKDIICVDETNYNLFTSNKIHIIKLTFNNPNYQKIKTVFDNYQKTNRFIINDNIKIYNSLLKNVNKKYYVMNNTNNTLISFFKRNNKVVLNTHNLKTYEKDFIKNETILYDILNNLEVIITDNEFFNMNKKIFLSWHGNLILSEDNVI